MSEESRPASPEQVRLLVGLSSLLGLPMIAFVMAYVTSQQAAPNQALAWRAFAFAMAAGACMGLGLVRFVRVFGGSQPDRPAARRLLLIIFAFSLIVVEAVGRLAHQALPVTMGYIAGTDAVLATVLLIRSLRRLGEIAAPHQ